MSKSFIKVIFFVCLIALVSSYKHNYEWGSLEKDNILLARDFIIKPPYFGMITTDDYVYKAPAVS